MNERDRVFSRARQLDLGSGDRPAEGFLGLDKLVHRPELGVWQFDLATGEPWPFADEQVQQLRSSHLIEHLPAGEVCAHEFSDESLGLRSKVPTPWLRSLGLVDALCWFMNEAWRVAARGAQFELRWPAMVDLRWDPPRWVTTAFLDPTHRRFIPHEQLVYFSAAGRQALQVASYPLSCDWSVKELAQGSLGGEHVENIAWLVKE
jgi:hypothetical protein